MEVRARPQGLSLLSGALSPGPHPQAPSPSSCFLALPPLTPAVQRVTKANVGLQGHQTLGLPLNFPITASVHPVCKAQSLLTNDFNIYRRMA